MKNPTEVPKPSVQLVLTGDEQTVLLNLIHRAVQVDGLNVALNAVILAQKVQNAPAIPSIAAPADITDPPQNNP